MVGRCRQNGREDRIKKAKPKGSADAEKKASEDTRRKGEQKRTAAAGE